MLNNREITIYNEIYNFISKNNYSPTIRELCKILNIKSTKTIYLYLKKLNDKKMITYQPNKKRSIIINKSFNNKLVVINTNTEMKININSNHLIYQIKTNNFEKCHLKKNDYLIINIKKKIKNNDLGLFLINNEYRIMKYNYIDSYYILEDNEKEILNSINLIGTVEAIYRNKI